MHFHWLLSVDRDLLKYTHRWRQIQVRSRQQTCFSFSMPRKFFNKPFEFLLYKTNILHFPVCVYCNRSQKTSQRVKNNSHATRLRIVSYFLFFTRCCKSSLGFLGHLITNFPRVMVLLIDIFKFGRHQF